MRQFQLLLFCIFLAASSSLSAQSNSKAFVLGQDEAAYEQLTASHSRNLLEAADNNLPYALEQWLEMMVGLEEYANRINYKLDGVKMFMHVFYAPDGSVDKLGFILRPDSRHVKEAELKALLNSFLKDYKFTITSDKPFNHYTGATFPTFSRRSK